MKAIFKKMVATILAIVMLSSTMSAMIFAIEPASLSTTYPELVVDEMHTANIEEGGAMAYFYFTPSEDGTYIFTSYSDDDTYGYLYDSQFYQITRDDDGGNGNNFRITYNLVAGETYYFGARYYSSENTGSFDVKLFQPPIESIDFEPTNIIEKTNGYWSNGYNENDEYVEYYRYYWDNKLSYTVTFKDGTEVQGTGAYFEYNGEEYYIECQDNQSSTSQWTVGNTYNPTVSVLGYNCEVPVTINESPVESIEFEPINIIEKTNGYWSNGYNENDEYVEYYRYNWYDKLSYTVTLKDGTEVQGTGQYFDYNGEEYYIERQDNQSASNQWTVGNTYYPTISVLGYSCEVPVTIIDTPIESIEFEPINIVEKTNGDWQEGWTENDEYVEYYRYSWWYNLAYTITFKDGTEIQGDSRWFDYNGEEYYIGRQDNQSAANQWTVGNTYNPTISVLGYSCEVPVTINETPVESIEFEPTNIIEVNNGFWDNGYNENDEYVEYWFYRWYYELSYTINFKDGSQTKGNGTYLYYNGEEYYIEYQDNQNAANQWTVGNTYYPTISVLGYNCEVPVTIVETPVESVKVEPINIIEGTNRYWTDDDGYFEYWRYNWDDEISYTATLKDGTEIKGTGTYLYYNGEEYHIAIQDNQKSNLWTVGNTYYPTISVLGYNCEVPVTIVETPVESVKVEPINIIEKTNGYWQEGWNENAEFVDYFHYHWWYKLSYTITLKDGTEIKGTDIYLDYNGEEYYIERQDNQSLANQWTVGNTYYPTMNVLGYETEVPVTIVESPIESIEIEPIDIIKETDGWWYEDCIEDEDGNEESVDYYCYEWSDNLSYTVTLKDGTKIKGIGQYFVYNDEEYYIDWQDNQSASNQWTAGNAYYPTISVLGYSCEVPVTIIDTPIESIEFEPINIIENSSGEWEWDWSLPEADVQYFCYYWWNKLSYTVTLKDGTEIQGIGTWFNYNGEEYNIQCRDNQSSANQWTVGNTYYPTMNVLGYETEVPVTIVESPIESIEIEPINITKNTSGNWNWDWITNEDGSEDEVKYYRYYWWNELSYTINFKDGSQTKGTGTWFNYNGEEFSIDYYDNQRAVNQWTTGNTYYETVSVMGCSCEVSITIENIKATPIDVDETKKAVVSKKGEMVYFQFTPSVSGVYTFTSDASKDTYGYLYDSDFSEIANDDDGGIDNNFRITYNLEAGETYYFAARYYSSNNTGSFKVKLTKAPTVIDIQVAPIEIIKEFGGYWDEDWIEDEDGNEEIVDYFYYRWDRKLSYTITFKDGTQVNGSGNWFYYDGEEYYIECQDNQNAGNQWTVGNTYYPTISVLGYSCEVPVTIVETPIESIEFEPINMVKDTDGYWDEDWIEDEDGNEEIVDYFYYEWYDNISYTINFNDGTQIKGYDSWFDYDGEEYRIQYQDNQSAKNPWIAGNTYYPTISVLGYSCEVPVTIGELKYENGIEYMVQNGIVVITGVSSSGDVLTIPEAIEGLPVVAITSLSGCEYNEIVIPDTITSLSAAAFDGCYDLTKITIGTGVKTLSNRMFIDAYNLTEIVVSDKNVKYTSVDGIVYDKDVTTMVAIPYGKTTQHTVPETATDIYLYISGSYKFGIVLLNDNTGYITEDGVIYNKDKTIVYACDPTKTGSYTMPDTVEIINNAAFKNSSLEKVVVSQKVTDIVYCAFMNNENLKEVVLPNTLTSISQGAFQGCGNLTDVNMPSELTSIGNNAFASSGIKKADIPGGVKTIESSAFMDSDLEELTLAEGIKEIEYAAFMNTKLKEVKIPDSMDIISTFAFNGSTLESVDLGNGIQEIDDFAFANTNLKAVRIPDSVVYLGDCVFDGSKVKDLQIGAGITSTGSYTFIGMEIETLTLPSNVTEVAYKSFMDCSKLADIELPDTLEKLDGTAFQGTAWYDNQSGGVIYIGTSLYGYKGDMPDNTNIIIKDGTKIIANYAFELQENLASITLPTSVKTIGLSAFSNCFNISDVYYSGSQEDREKIDIDTGNYWLEQATWHYNYVCTHKFENDCDGDCNICGEIRPIVHDFADATCTEAETCNLCGETRNEALGHNSDAGTVTKEATCSETGTKVYKCTRCEEVIKTEVLAQLTHDFAAATCNKAETCNLCGEARGEALGHNSDAGTVTKEPTCTETGIKTYKCTRCEEVIKTEVLAQLTHDFAAATCDKAETCKLCGETRGEALGHNSDAGTVTKEPTCTETGIKTYKCTRCEEVLKTEVLAQLTHDFAAATCDKAETCKLCGETRGEALGHNSDDGTVTKEATCSETGIKTYKCARCEEVIKTETLDKLPHEYSEATCENPETCEACGQTRGEALGHIGGEATCEEKAICTRCEEEYGDFADHIFSNANCTEAKTCEICGDTEGDELGHSYSNACDKDCNRCGAKRTTKHKYSNNCDTTCNVCNAVRSVTHAYKTTTKAATTSKNGSVVKKCTVCGKVASTTTIKYAKTFKLSTTEYTYNGKNKKPSVVVKDSSNKVLKNKVDYIIHYPSSTKNVGTYKVKIELKGKYSGTKTLSFKINPSKTTVSKLTAGKKKLTVNITKKSTQVTGYEIQYSTSKKFTSSKTKTIKSNKTTKVTLSSLKAKKTYYVRVRTYKTVNGKKYYSDWSGYKSKKTK